MAYAHNDTVHCQRRESPHCAKQGFAGAFHECKSCRLLLCTNCQTIQGSNRCPNCGQSTVRPATFN